MTGTVPGAAADRRRSEHTLVGRGAEIARLHDVVDGLRRGRSARILVTGEPGIGATALVDAFCGQLEGDLDGVVVVRVVAPVPVITPVAFATVDLLARALDDLVAPDRPTSGRSAVALHDVLLAARHLSGRRRPVVLALHDLQFVDPASATVLTDLVRRLDAAGLLVLASAPDPTRGAGGRAWWPRLFAADGAPALSLVEVRTVTLGGLDAAAVAAFVATRRPSGAAPAPAVVSQLVARTGGHPVRLEVLVRTLGDDALSGASPLGPPRTFEDLVGGILEELDAGARALLRALSVLRGPVPRLLLGRVADGASDDAAVARAVATGLVVPSVDGPRVELRFVHRLVRDAVYRSLPPGSAAAMHRAAASVLGGRTGLAHAVAAAADSPAPDLAAALVAAAGAENDHGEAATLLLWAADLADRGPVREDRLVAAAVHLVQAGAPGRLREIEPELRAARAGAARDLALGVLASEAGEPDAYVPLEAARRDTSASDEVRALATLRLATDHVLHGRGARAVEVIDGFEALTAEPALREAGHATRTLGIALHLGAATALDHLGRVDGVYGPDLLVVAGRLALATGDPVTAYERLRQGLDRIRSGAATTMGRLVHLFLAEAAFRTGRWAEAEAEARVGATSAGEAGSTWVGPTAHAMWAVVLAARGASQEAEDHLAEVRRAPVRGPDPLGAFTVRVAEAFVAHLRGDAGRAYRLLSDLADGPVPALEASPLALWRVLLADVAIDADRLGAAGAVLDEWPVAGVPLWFALSRHRLTGRLAEHTGDVAQARDLYRAGLTLVAVREVDGAWCPIEVAALHAASGRLGRRQGWVSAAEELAIARSTFARLGAAPWVARVDAEIDRAVPGIGRGAPSAPAPRAAPTAESSSGPGRAPTPPDPWLAVVDRPPVRADERAGSLTPRELEVVRLVAQGLTSREVAAALHVTPKAISYHLGNVFGKLGVSSRRQLWGRTFD